MHINTYIVTCSIQILQASKQNAVSVQDYNILNILTYRILNVKSPVCMISCAGLPLNTVTHKERISKTWSSSSCWDKIAHLVLTPNKRTERWLSTSFGMEANSDDKSNHPASFSTVEATGLRLDSVSIFFETSSTDLGNLWKTTRYYCLYCYSLKRTMIFMWH